MKWINALERFPDTVDIGRELPVRIRGGLYGSEYTELVKTGTRAIKIKDKTFYQGDNDLKYLDWLMDEIDKPDPKFNIEWHSVEVKPSKKYGWFAVAVVPADHSGSGRELREGSNRDNSWRELFGFSKAWLNNGQWWEADHHGSRSKNITHLVTHWAYLPAVPELEKPFIFNGREDFISEFQNKEIKKQLREEAERAWEKASKTHPEGINPHAYVLGFMDALLSYGQIRQY